MTSIAHGIRGLVVRDALDNAKANGADFTPMTIEEIAIDMLDCCEPVGRMFYEENRGELWKELIEHITAWFGGKQ